MKKILFYILFLAAIKNISAQELNCNVSVIHQQIQGSNKQVFNTLQTAIYEFMNNKTWTNHVFTPNEKIECNILINLTSQLSADEFKGEIQIQARRPVYGTSYSTVMLNYKDPDLRFSYVEYEPLEFSLTSHNSNLTAILAYYAYIIIGLDYDSFSMLGGTPYFQNAERIVNNAQNTPERGWKAYESTSRKNRYWFINNILDADYEPARRFYYTYHRQGLDLMDQNMEKARTNVIEALKELEKVYKDKPDPFMHFMQVIFDAKADEFVNIFLEANSTDKDIASNILNEIDPANSNKYEKIKGTGN